MSRVQGFVEIVTREQVGGWAFDEDDPARPVAIEVVFGGERVAIGQADQPRDDLAALGMARSSAGFSVSLPRGTRVDLAAMEVRVPGTAEPLPVAEAAGVYEGVFEQEQGRTISGWAWRCGHAGERVRVVVRHRGEIVASGLADDLRDDLRASGIGDGRHGFVMTLRVIDPPYRPETITVEFEATGLLLGDLRPPGSKPAAPPAAHAGAPSIPRPTNLFVPRAGTSAPEARPAPAAPRPTPPAAAGAYDPPAIAPPPPAPPAPAPLPAARRPETAFPLSPEAYEALRGAVNFGPDQDDLA